MFGPQYRYTDQGFLRHGLSYNMTSNSSDVYLYNNQGRCAESNRDYEQEDGSNSTSPTEALHLSEIMGMDLDQNNDMMDCNTYKIWDTEEKNGLMTTRIYNDILIYIYSYRWRIDNHKRQTAEEKIEYTKNGYQIAQVFSDLSEGKKLLMSVENLNETMFIQISAIALHDYPFSSLNRNPESTPIVSLILKLHENEKERIKAQLTIGEGKIFDAWFFSTSEVQSAMKYVAENFIHFKKAYLQLP